jgi:hypothetical protein
MEITKVSQFYNSTVHDNSWDAIIEFYEQKDLKNQKNQKDIKSIKYSQLKVEEEDTLARFSNLQYIPKSGDIVREIVYILKFDCVEDLDSFIENNEIILHMNYGGIEKRGTTYTEIDSCTLKIFSDYSIIAFPLIRTNHNLYSSLEIIPKGIEIENVCITCTRSFISILLDTKYRKLLAESEIVINIFRQVKETLPKRVKHDDLIDKLLINNIGISDNQFFINNTINNPSGPSGPRGPNVIKCINGIFDFLK